MSRSESHLLLLHGALGTEAEFRELVQKLDNSFQIHTLDFEGHGQAGSSSRPFSIQSFSENVLEFMREKKIDQAKIFGYSMGGYVALYLARHFPDKITAVSTLGTILKWDDFVAQRELKYLKPESIEKKVPEFAGLLEQRHPHGWKTVVRQTANLLSDLGKNPPLQPNDWAAIKQPVRLHVGDRDTTAEPEETTEVFHQIENAELAVLPETPHAFHQADVTWLAYSLNTFFNPESGK